MEKITREQIRKIFFKVKKLRFPDDFDTVDWVGLQYYSWREATDNVLYMLYEFRGELIEIRWKLSQKKAAKRLETCEICHKHRKSAEVALVTAKTKFLPKNIDYRTRGNYVCLDYLKCNGDMKDDFGIENLFCLILDKEE